MCNRHVTHMIADYEAARLDEDEKEAEGQESRDSEQTARVHTVGCNPVKIFATRGGEIIHGLTADSISLDCWRLSGAVSFDKARFRPTPLAVSKLGS